MKLIESGETVLWAALFISVVSVFVIAFAQIGFFG